MRQYVLSPSQTAENSVRKDGFFSMQWGFRGPPPVQKQQANGIDQESQAKS